MPRTAILICSPDHPVLSKAIGREIGLNGIRVLADQVALQGRTEASADELRRRLDGEPIDVIVRNEVRRSSLLVADMDSTLIEQECIDELADVAGVGKRVAAITERAMRGEIDFEDAQRERMALLKGRPEADIDTVIEERITFMPGARSLVATMRAHGAYTVIVSGGFLPFTGYVAEQLGFDEHHSNILEVEDGRLTGRPVPPVLGRDAKEQRLKETSSSRSIPVADAMGVGDGANDLAMLAAAGTGVAFRAKPIVAEAARHRIDHGDLTALLYMQGYTADQIID